MIIIGIDPGKTGGIAAILTENPSHIFIEPMDLYDSCHGALTALTDACPAPTNDLLHIFVEKAQAMPKQGVVSVFNYGVHFGEILATLKLARTAHTLVPPKTWTKVMHAGTKTGPTKQRSLEAARRLFPSTNFIAEHGRKPHLGMVEAALIAEYGRRQLGVNS